MSDNNQRIQANQLAADTGAIVRTMMLASAEYEFLRLTAIRSVMARRHEQWRDLQRSGLPGRRWIHRGAHGSGARPRAWRTSRWKAWRLS